MTIKEFFDIPISIFFALIILYFSLEFSLFIYLNKKFPKKCEKKKVPPTIFFRAGKDNRKYYPNMFFSNFIVLFSNEFCFDKKSRYYLRALRIIAALILIGLIYFIISF